MGDAAPEPHLGAGPLERAFAGSNWRPRPGWIPLTGGERNRGLRFVTNSHILLSSKPFESDSLAVAFFPSIL